MPYRKTTFVRPEPKLHKRDKVTDSYWRIFWNNEEIYLGPWDGKSTIPGPDVLARYLRVVAELEEQWQRSSFDRPASAEPLRIVTAVAEYLEMLKTTRRPEGAIRKDGTLSSAWAHAKAHLQPLAVMYGDTLAEDFRGSEQRTLRKAVLNATWYPPSVPQSRRKRWSDSYTNSVMATIRRMFAYLESTNQVREGKTKHLDSLQPIECEEKERKPVADAHIETTIRYTSPQVAAMVRLQRITGARPSEIFRARPADIRIENDGWWTLVLRHHKTESYGHVREIPLGPLCQEILRPFLNRDAQEYCFSPAEAAEWWRQNGDKIRSYSKGQRKTPLYPNEIERRAAAKATRRMTPAKRQYAPAYTKDTYRQAIAYAIKHARAAGHEVPDWTPYQLRHARITEVQARDGWEAAQAVAGHEHLSTTKRYAHERAERRLRIARITQEQPESAIG